MSQPKITTTNLTILLIGLLLIYAAIKDVSPITAAKNALKGKPTPGVVITPPPPPLPPTPTPTPTPTGPGTNPNNSVAV